MNFNCDFEHTHINAHTVTLKFNCDAKTHVTHIKFSHKIHWAKDNFITYASERTSGRIYGNK